MSDAAFYARELASNECQCGARKKRGWAFSQDMQQALYARIGNGYEEAYEEAVKELTE